VILYADTSAIVRAHLPDEPDHPTMASLLLDGENVVVSSELTRIEFTSAIASAHRAGHLEDPAKILERFETDCWDDDGLLTLLRFDPITAMPLARELVRAHPLRTLDALHLAVALTDARETGLGDRVAMVTGDHRLADAAKANGLEVR
jgi:predicted nucleic acid-binding protein